MTEQEIVDLGPAFAGYLARFRRCFVRKTTAGHFDTYCRGLLSDLPRKSVEPIALEAGTAVRTLQEFLVTAKWDHGHARDLLQHHLANFIGELTDDAPLFVDGFITQKELTALRAAGAVGEIVGWSFDAEGQMIRDITNERVASVPIPSRETSLVIAAAKGERKFPGIAGAIRGGLINGLITDEETAEHLLKAL